MLDQEVKTSKANVRIRRQPSQNGEPAVLIHGLGASGHNWFPFMSHIADQLDMTAPDLPGFGESLPPIDQDHSPKNFAEIMVEVIEKTYPGESVHLFGNSLGGAVAVQLAARHPNLVKSLTLVSPALPTLFPDLSAAPVVLSAIPKFGEKLMQRYFELPAAERANNTIQTTFGDPRNTPENWHEAITRELAARDLQPHQLASLLATLRSLLATFFDRSEQSPWNLVKSISAPSLFIYGGKDKLVHPRAAKKVPYFAPKAQVRVLAETGHVAHIEHTAWVAEEFSENLLRNRITY
jgi:pimeloyl-ACP methyl ester carboxylesterase